MAVLKYRSTDGTIKILPIISNGNGSGTIPDDVMTTINQHTEDINGLETQTQQLTTAVGAINDSLPTKYSAINPPPPVNNYYAATSGTDRTITVPPKNFVTVYISGFNLSVTEFANYIHIARWDSDLFMGVGVALRDFSGGRPLVSLFTGTNNAFLYAYSATSEPSTISGVIFTLFNFGNIPANITITTDETGG